jgi:predicted ATPase
MGGTGHFFSVSNLSVGTTRLLQMVVSILFDQRSLMLIEQPEDSIHPGLLQKLISILRTYSHETQILFTTHSLAVLDILHPEEILLATAPEGSTTVRKLTPDEIERAKSFLENEGSLSDFLEPLDELY